MPVLERPGEERALRRRMRLELAPVVAEADDHRPRVELAQRLEQHVDALVVEELPEVDDRRLGPREERAEPLARCPRPAAARPRCRGSADRAGLLEQRRRAPRPRARAPLLDVDAGRHLVHAVDVAAHLLEHLADVRRADEHGLRSRERLGPSALELGSAAHRVLELRAVRLDGVRRAGSRGPPPRRAGRGCRRRGRPAGARATAAAFASTQRVELVVRQVLEQLRPRSPS